jgi:hypothetical protein
MQLYILLVLTSIGLTILTLWTDNSSHKQFIICDQKEPLTEQRSQFTTCKPWMRKEIYQDTNQVHPQNTSMQFLRFCSLFLTFRECDWGNSSILMENLYQFVCRLTKRIDTMKHVYIHQFACICMTTGTLWWVEKGSYLNSITWEQMWLRRTSICWNPSASLAGT